MNVVAASNLPPPHGETTTWYKRILSKWPSRKRDTGATAATCMAAATEKFIGHSSAIQCENLTAKEFAHLTGLDIKDDNGSGSSDQDTQGSEGGSLSSVSLHAHTTIRSSRTTASHKKPRIWDQDFWHQQTSPLTKTCTSSSSCTAPVSTSTATKSTSASAIATTTATTTSSSSSSHHTTLSAISDFSSSAICSASTTLTTCSGHEAFLTQLRRKSTRVSVCSIDGCMGGARPCSVIQKGRFKIVVGDHPDQDDGQHVGQESNDPSTAVVPPVLEWKRKRSQEASCTTHQDALNP
ncbi:unnamed protein product [Absidia cylindrospora]